MGTPFENDGGEAGGLADEGPVPRLILKRSELAILRKMADRYPIVEGERREVVDTVMDIVRNAKSKRLKLAASKAMCSLDKVNLDEMRTYLLAQKIVADDLKPATVINNINSVTNEHINQTVYNIDAEQFSKLSGAEKLRVLQQSIQSPSAN